AGNRAWRRPAPAPRPRRRRRPRPRGGTAAAPTRAAGGAGAAPWPRLRAAPERETAARDRSVRRAGVLPADDVDVDRPRPADDLVDDRAPDELREAGLHGGAEHQLGGVLGAGQRDEGAGHVG